MKTIQFKEENDSAVDVHVYLEMFNIYERHINCSYSSV